MANLLFFSFFLFFYSQTPPPQYSKIFFIEIEFVFYAGVMGYGAAEATGPGFVCFVVINPCVLSATEFIWFGLFCLINFPILLPPPPPPILCLLTFKSCSTGCDECTAKGLDSQCKRCANNYHRTLSGNCVSDAISCPLGYYNLKQAGQESYCEGLLHSASFENVTFLTFIFSWTFQHFSAPFVTFQVAFLTVRNASMVTAAPSVTQVSPVPFFSETFFYTVIFVRNFVSIKQKNSISPLSPGFDRWAKSTLDVCMRPCSTPTPDAKNIVTNETLCEHKFGQYNSYEKLLLAVFWHCFIIDLIQLPDATCDFTCAASFQSLSGTYQAKCKLVGSVAAWVGFDCTTGGWKRWMWTLVCSIYFKIFSNICSVRERRVFGLRKWGYQHHLGPGRRIVGIINNVGFS